MWRGYMFINYNLSLMVCLLLLFFYSIMFGLILIDIINKSLNFIDHRLMVIVVDLVNPETLW